MGKDNAQVRGQLGLDPTIIPFVIPDYDEIVRIYDQTVKIEKLTLGNSWIVGSSTNGLVGTNTATQGGGQQVVGGSSRVRTTVTIANNNNTYYDFFTTTRFKDSETTTGDWTTSGTAEVALNEILQSSTIYKDTGSAVSAIMSVDFTTGSAGTIYAYLSATGTATGALGTATLDETYTFPTAGRNMCWKIKGRSNTVITKVKIKYTTN